MRARTIATDDSTFPSLRFFAGDGAAAGSGNMMVTRVCAGGSHALTPVLRQWARKARSEDLEEK